MDRCRGARHSYPCFLCSVFARACLVDFSRLEPGLASRVLASGGLLAFTLERHDGDGFIMGEGRRYAHSASYMRASIEAVGLVVLQFEQHSARCEGGVPVPGLVIVAVKS